MFRFAWCLFVLLPASVVAQQARKPFPQHTVYTPGTIKPNQYSQSQLDTSVENFYAKWKKHYIRYSADKEQAYVFCNADGLWRGGNKASNSISLSEGHGYGMLIMATMAGYDPEAHDIFDKMVRFFKHHPSNINHGLMAWDQTRDSVINEYNSDDATDGDLDIAYALLLADAQWGSNGRYNYLQEAKNIMDSLKKTNINHDSKTMIMGDFTEKGEPYYCDTRSSDFMPDHFKAFAHVNNDPAWDSVTDKEYALLRFMQKKYSPLAGLLPDFIKGCDKMPRPAGPFFIEKRIDGCYSYNACRIPWRLAGDYLINGDARDTAILNPINHWLQKKCKNDPLKIMDGYNLNGKAVTGASGDNFIFIGCFGTGLMVNAHNQQFLNNIWDYAISEPLADEEYYGNTVKLLTMIMMSGNWIR